MTLEFPNQSRSYDSVRNRIQFWGYDSAIEVTIFVDSDVLQKIDPAAATDESGCLAVFDSAREKIETVARETYHRQGRGTYACALTTKDF